jgi:hypothetical protein
MSGLFEEILRMPVGSIEGSREVARQGDHLAGERQKEGGLNLDRRGFHHRDQQGHWVPRKKAHYDFPGE